MERISIEDIDSAHSNGIVKVWWFRDGGKLNEEWESMGPIWNILTSFQLYQLLTDQETLITYAALCDGFIKVQEPIRKNYFKDHETYLESFQCGVCGTPDQEQFIYDRTVANGEVWICKNCNEELLVNEEPNEDNY